MENKKREMPRCSAVYIIKRNLINHLRDDHGSNIPRNSYQFKRCDYCKSIPEKWDEKT